MTRITRAVTARALVDLLTSAKVAIVAWSRDGEVAAEPVAFRYADGSYFIGAPSDLLTVSTEVAVLIDSGPLYFDLRGVRLRGRLARAEARGDGLEWFEVAPEREVAWHYGALRER